MLLFLPPDPKYAASYCDTFDQIARESIYLASTEGFPLKNMVEFVQTAQAVGYPMRMVIDTDLDRCVGWCDAIPREPTVGYLGTGLLLPYRGQGVGSRLVKEVMDLSEAFGYHSIELDVRASNIRAIHVYGKLGFKRTGLVVGGFRLGANHVTEDVVQMSVALP